MTKRELIEALEALGADDDTATMYMNYEERLNYAVNEVGFDEIEKYILIW